MKFDLFPYGKPFNLVLGIRVFKPLELSLKVSDTNSHRVYALRRISLKQDKAVLIKLPIVPNELTAEITSNYGGEQYFKVEQIKLLADTRCPLDLTENDRRFIAFIKWFATEAVRLEAGEKGTLYQNDGFTILYVDKIVNDGIEITTPARIARDTGIIEVSKSATYTYTVPMLIVMLLHEYAHKWKNPEYGRAVSNELSADLIAVHIALNLGFDPREVENCFRSVFAKKDTDLNRRRIAAIRDFIHLFSNTEHKRCKR